MPTLIIEFTSDAERLMLVQASAHMQAMNRLALAAPSWPPASRSP